MERGIQSVRLATLLGLVAITGCLHHNDVAACAPNPGETECWVSSRRDADGRLRHVVIERVTPADRCDKVLVVQDSFDERGVLVAHAVDERRCRVIEQRRVDRYDLAAGEIRRDIWLDTNHDDAFDRFVGQTVHVSESERDFAEHAAQSDEAEIDAAHREENDR
jgi:hypothetical protein